MSHEDNWQRIVNLAKQNAALADRLDAVEKGLDATDLITSKRCHTLEACLDELERHVENLYNDKALLASRIERLEELQKRTGEHLADAAQKHDALEQQVEHEWRARQMADDGNSACTGALEQRHEGLVLFVSELATRLDTLEAELKEIEL